MAQYTPQRVQQEIERLSARLESKSDELAGLLHAAGVADVAHKVANAKALLRSRAKTVSEREAEAVIEVEDLLLQKRIAEAQADSCREAVRATRDQLTAACSIGATLRAEMQLAGPLGRTA